MPFKIINGVNYYYEESGSGEDIIVFSHGLLWSCRMFDKQVEALKETYTVVAYDHRGQGKTEITESGYDMDTLSEDALELIKSFGRPVHFAGLSMGGFVAMRLAARHPELIKSLILMETSADPEPAVNVPKYKRLNRVAKILGFRFVTGPVMKIMFSKSFLADKTKTEEKKYWEKQLRANDKKGIPRAVMGVVERKGIHDELAKITCPTLIIVGEEDVATLPTEAEKMHKAIKGSKLVYIPKAGHTSSVEQGNLVNKEIKEFLSSLS